MPRTIKAKHFVVTLDVSIQAQNAGQAVVEVSRKMGTTDLSVSRLEVEEDDEANDREEMEEEEEEED